MNPEALHAFRQGAAYFNARDFYQAHEAWEDYWLQIGDSKADLWKGLIQIAVACLHWQRGNSAGARRLQRKAMEYLRPFAPEYEGLPLTEFLQQLEQAFAPLHQAFQNRKAAPRLDPDALPLLAQDWA
ncbi:MAG: DUF309 domain-containing protein [Planctomycetota bacterium]|nr:MAG: DUF309 domain-containing protein [Planctomycetota bacterium]